MPALLFPMNELASVTDSEQGRQKRRRITLGRLLFVAIVLFMLGSVTMRVLRSTFPTQVERGIAPALELALFDGSLLRLEDLRGQGVVVNFWASWCAPCRAEAALLEAGWLSVQGQGIQFVGVAVQDTEEAARAFVREFGVSYATGLDATGAWDTAFGVRGLPETFFISTDGHIVDRVSGALLNEDDLQRRLDRIRPPVP